MGLPYVELGQPCLQLYLKVEAQRIKLVKLKWQYWAHGGEWQQGCFADLEKLWLLLKILVSRKYSFGNRAQFGYYKKYWWVIDLGPEGETAEGRAIKILGLGSFLEKRTKNNWIASQFISNSVVTYDIANDGTTTVNHITVEILLWFYATSSSGPWQTLTNYFTCGELARISIKVTRDNGNTTLFVTFADTVVGQGEKREFNIILMTRHWCRGTVVRFGKIATELCGS